MPEIIEYNYDDVNLERFLRVIIMDNSSVENTKHSINSIKDISNNIPISILTQDNSYYDFPEEEIIEVTSQECIINILNQLLREKHEDFFCILNSGDIILDSFLKIFSKDSCFDLNSVGAIIFDDMFIDTCEYNYKLGFSPDLYLEVDYIFNSLFINRNLANKSGGFSTALKNNFIRDIIFRMYYEGYKILKKDFLVFKIISKFHKYDLNEDKLFLKTCLDNNIDYEIICKKDNIKPIYNAHNKLASIIIPFRDQPDITRNCIESILEKTDYENYEVILINNNSCEDKTFELMEELDKHPKIRLFNFDNLFNWSKINNFGFYKSKGDVLIFLNNDTEVISPDWLSILIGDAIQEKTGVVGAKLFFPDNTIQHMGVVIGLESLASHLFAKCHEDEIPNLYSSHRRNVSAVTGACLAIERKLFENINGFNEDFEVSFSDVELCLRLLKKGYNNIINPDVKLYHHEMKTRGNKEFRDVDRVLGYYAFSYYFEKGDPFFNENFSLNNSMELTLKKEGEIPGYKNYWKKWSKNRDDSIYEIEKRIMNGELNSTLLKFNFSSDDSMKKYNGINEYELKMQYTKCNPLIKKILNPFSLLYLIIRSHPCEISINLKLLNCFKKCGCFDVGYYLKNNNDLLNTIWFKYFPLEIHYICHGFNEHRQFNKRHIVANSKKELLINLFKHFC